jgi:hypothetical protein
MFNQTQRYILDGLMIGDGYLPPNQNLFYFGQAMRNREYVVHVANQLGIPAERVKDRTRKPVGDLIMAVSSCSRNNREAVAAVADLLETGKVRLNANGRKVRAHVY